MDYSITITGTIDDTDNPDAEDELLSDAQDFVGELEGVAAASFNSPNYANVDLTETEDVEVEAAPSEPVTPEAAAEEGEN